MHVVAGIRTPEALRHMVSNHAPWATWLPRHAELAFVTLPYLRPRHGLGEAHPYTILLHCLPREYLNTTNRSSITRWVCVVSIKMGGKIRVGPAIFM